MDQKEAERFNTREVQASMPRVVLVALSNALQTGFESASNAPEIVFFHLVEKI